MTFQTLAEVERLLLQGPPRRRVIVPDILPAGPCIVYGPSSTGKTGIGIRTAVTVAAGLHWAGRPVTQGAVLYIAGEDIDGARERLVAAAYDLGLKPAELPIAIMEAPADGLVASAARVEVVAAATRLSKEKGLPVSLIVVDTLAASFGPKSQDDAAAASEYMNHADRTARELGCAFLSIHHTGKIQNAGMRGSQVFFDRSNAVLRVKRGPATTSFVLVEKMRNGPSGAQAAFDIAGRDIKTSGGPVSVQVIRQLRAIEAAAPPSEGLMARRKLTIADQVLGILVRLSSATKRPVSKEEWREASYAMLVGKSADTCRKTFHKARKQLLKDGLVQEQNESVTVTVTGYTKVTPIVTPEPESVTVTDPPSIDGVDSDVRTGPQVEDLDFLEPNCAEGAERNLRRSARRMPCVGGVGVKPPQRPGAAVTVTATVRSEHLLTTATRPCPAD